MKLTKQKDFLTERLSFRTFLFKCEMMVFSTSSCIKWGDQHSRSMMVGSYYELVGSSVPFRSTKSYIECEQTNRLANGKKAGKCCPIC